MKKILIALCFLFSSLCADAQSMYSDAVAAMNNGKYADAKIYWMALNDSRDSYGSRIKTCDFCIDLQNKARKNLNSKQYSKAVELYQAILRYNPYDHSAKTMIKKCLRLQEESNAENTLTTYTNYPFSYSFKHPAYLVKQSSSTDDRVSFMSSDSKLRVDIITVQKSLLKTNTQILNEVITSYSSAKITYKVIKMDWVVLSGYLADGRVFYNKSIITTRQSQYDEPVTILISAEVISYKNDSRGSKIADMVSKDLIVSQTGPVVQVKESDQSRWIRAKKIDTSNAYTKYITYAPTTSPYLEEAKLRRTLCHARKSFEDKDYVSAKAQFELAQKYMTNYDFIKYEESCYQYCVYHDRTLITLRGFMETFPDNPKMKVVHGGIVKEYCKLRMYKEAKKYVKSHLNIWFNEQTYYSEKQWMKYIKAEKQRANRTSYTSNYNTSLTYGAGMNLY